MKFLFPFVLLLIHAPCFGDAIDAVIEKQSAHLTLKSNARMEVTLHYKIKILNEAGDHHAIHEFHTNRNRTFKKFDILVNDASGNQIAKYNIKNFQSTPYIQSLAFFEDIRTNKLDTRVRSYPYTLDITIEFARIPFEYKWEFGSSGNTTVLQSDLYISGNLDTPFKYLLEHDSLIQINDQSEGTIRTMHFELKNPKMQILENMLSGDDKTIPSARITPLKFQYGKEICSLESWEKFGNSIQNLWAGRQSLPTEAMTELDALRKKHSDTESLARAVYSYVQNKFRYVYIGYGLGGMQAISATDTYKTGYGDCKGLSNFTNAAMNYVGIKSYSALIYGGSDTSNETPDYVSDWFNHVVVCLPEIGDTTWLECTSQSTPFGYTSDFTDNRWAMLITEAGGIMARTPALPATANFGMRNVMIEMMPDGDATISADLKYGSLAMEETAFYRREFTGQETHRAFNAEFDIKSFDLQNYTCERFGNGKPEITVKTKATARFFGRKAGSKLLISPFLLKLYVPSIDTLALSKPFHIDHGYQYTDSVQINIGEGYSPENLPKPSNIACDAGNFEITYHFDPDGKIITIVRHLIYHAGEYPGDKQKDMRLFFTEVKKSDQTMLVLGKV